MSAKYYVDGLSGYESVEGVIELSVPLSLDEDRDEIEDIVSECIGQPFMVLSWSRLQ